MCRVKAATCGAEADGAGGQVVLVGAVGAALASVEAAVHALAGQHYHVVRQVRIHRLSEHKHAY